MTDRTDQATLLSTDQATLVSTDQATLLSTDQATLLSTDQATLVSTDQAVRPETVRPETVDDLFARVSATALSRVGGGALLRAFVSLLNSGAYADTERRFLSRAPGSRVATQEERAFFDELQRRLAVEDPRRI
jgi:hypothetical protein